MLGFHFISSRHVIVCHVIMRLWSTQQLVDLLCMCVWVCVASASYIAGTWQQDLKITLVPQYQDSFETPNMLTPFLLLLSATSLSPLPLSLPSIANFLGFCFLSNHISACNVLPCQSNLPAAVATSTAHGTFTRLAVGAVSSRFNFTQCNYSSIVMTCDALRTRHQHALHTPQTGMSSQTECHRWLNISIFPSRDYWRLSSYKIM